MNGPDLLAVAADWSHWDRPPPPSVPRSVRLPGELRPELALVVQECAAAASRRCSAS